MAGLGFKLPLAFFLIFLFFKMGEADVSLNFYKSTCPTVESVVQQAVAKKFGETPVTAQATLRLFFHDCIVEGCDASILIDSASGDAEKDAVENQSLAGDGFDTVIRAKKAVEAVCPGVVSCADILALATRDVVVITGGPTFNVELGRRDGLRSKASDVSGQIPAPNFNLKQLVDSFAALNLTLTDMVALSGAHTIGVSHCSRFSGRLYNFQSSDMVDPDLDPAYAQQLMQACPRNVDPNIVVPLDPASPVQFDTQYYINLVQKKGLLTSDQVLFTDPASQAIVVDWANSAANFFSAFTEAMVKLGRVGVKTGDKGEIRLDCSRFNS
ncbi:hypothetical protein V2J09_005988 [Rumex salicifolius]